MGAVVHRLTLTNCHLSTLVPFLSQYRLFQIVFITILRSVRILAIYTGRYHSLENDITQFSRYLDSVQEITFTCQRGIEWAEEPGEQHESAPYYGRVTLHISARHRKGRLPTMTITAPEANAFGRHSSDDDEEWTGTWPRGLEDSFWRYLKRTAEWHNASSLHDALNKKRRRAGRRVCQMHLNIQLAMRISGFGPHDARTQGPANPFGLYDGWLRVVCLDSCLCFGFLLTLSRLLLLTLRPYGQRA